MPVGFGWPLLFLRLRGQKSKSNCWSLKKCCPLIISWLVLESRWLVLILRSLRQTASFLIIGIQIFFFTPLLEIHQGTVDAPWEWMYSIYVQVKWSKVKVQLFVWLLSDVYSIFLWVKLWIKVKLSTANLSKNSSLILSSNISK